MWTVFQLFIGALFLCLSLPFSAQTNAEYEVRGVVRDNASGESLPFANVFFSGTTLGTTSDKDGNFSLRPKTPGTYDLVVSFMGFKPFNKQVVITEHGVVEVRVNMLPEPRFIGGVTVVAKKDRRWKRLLRRFRTIFLGTSINSKGCEIINEEVIFLEYDEGTGIFEAYAGEPLIIENKALGYRIKYVLEDFKIYYKEGYSSFSGFPSFEEMEGKKQQQNIWIQARDRTFFGSIEHFFRELYRGNSSNAGFKVNKAKFKGKTIEVDRDIFPIDKFVKFGADSIRKELAFDNYIYVKYLHQAPDRGYIMTLPRTAPSEIRFGSGQLSWLEMPKNEKRLVFEESGYWVNARYFILEGYWSFPKMADLLPLNYVPGGG